MIVAHQGGWDEALFVVVPLAIFFVLLQVAKRRADAEARVEREARPGNDLDQTT